jgi:hypothetical protein
MKDRIFDHAPRGGVDLSTVLVSNLAYKIAVTQVKFVESHSDTFELGDCEYGVRSCSGCPSAAHSRG